MRAFFVELGEKPFRADQIMKWIYHFGCDDFDQMSNVNKALRERLKAIAEIRAPEISREQRSADGTIKWALQVGDQEVETVYIPEADRATLCVSSQVGCALACTFCSTAQQGFNRNLKVSEIIGQVWRAAKVVGGKRPITNVVMMGMGEPLLNLANVVPAMKLMMDDFGFSISKRRVTLSTSGVVPALDMLGRTRSRYRPGHLPACTQRPVAFRDHADQRQVQHRVLPCPGTPLSGQVQRQRRPGDRGVMVLLDHINDDMQHAHELAKVLKETPCKINLIPFNPFPGNPFGKPSNSRIDRFSKVLMEYGLTVIVRKTRGDDIDAACGQLVGEVIDRTKRTMKNRMQQDGISVKMV